MSKRVALVSGGIGGLGSRICIQLAQSGHTVVALDLLPDEMRLAAFCERVAGLDVHFEAGDVTDFAGCSALVQRLEQRFGSIDVLVNAAGITRDVTLRKMRPEQWADVLRVNLDGVFNLTQNVIAGMIERGYGRVVNISSINGQTGQFGQTNYSAAKAGMHGFTMALAREVARKGVTVNTVSPGYCETEMVKTIPLPLREQIIESIPVGRIGQPVDIARAVDFLCAEGSSFITGVNLPVNGGLFISF
ncbi:MAG: beta-ketoacyl-ACP reductase [Gammaproteobacteria bacterium HGW-Gammaproteobacteria-4]|nr:MAG: beta-ketoacyl-ACP reductase [Gammaproteobacteria bacterium HGW-Gammaproteobacteria-4]